MNSGESMTSNTMGLLHIDVLYLQICGLNVLVRSNVCLHII